MNDVQLCKICNKPLIFDETSNTYICMDCNQVYGAEEFEEPLPENGYTGSYQRIVCKLCGKKTILNRKDFIDVCPFCYNNLIDVDDYISDFFPQYMIPFKNTKSELISNIVDILKNSNCPSDIIANANINSIKGLYIPFFRYSIENEYRCFLETKEINNSKGNEAFYYQEICYKENLQVLCDATGYMPNSAIDDISDYNFKKMVPYMPMLLKEGYYTMSNTNTHDSVWKNLVRIVWDYDQKKMNKYVGKSEEIKNLTLYNNPKNIVRTFILLPVWVIESQSGGELHYIYINGQTDTSASDIHIDRPVKKSFFSKEKQTSFQVTLIDEMKIKYKNFNNGIDYHNEYRKYDGNSAERDQRIGALRTR